MKGCGGMVSGLRHARKREEKRRYLVRVSVQQAAGQAIAFLRGALCILQFQRDDFCQFARIFAQNDAGERHGGTAQVT